MIVNNKFHIDELVRVIASGVIDRVVGVWENKREGNRIFYKLAKDGRWYLEADINKIA